MGAKSIKRLSDSGVDATSLYSQSVFDFLYIAVIITDKLDQLKPVWTKIKQDGLDGYDEGDSHDGDNCYRDFDDGTVILMMKK